MKESQKNEIKRNCNSEPWITINKYQIKRRQLEVKDKLKINRLNKVKQGSNSNKKFKIIKNSVIYR